MTRRDGTFHNDKQAEHQVKWLEKRKNRKLRAFRKRNQKRFRPRRDEEDE